MIFEKQDYQQECITNIITLLKDFDFGIMKKTQQTSPQIEQVSHIAPPPDR